MTEALIVERDEALSLASELAARRGISVDDAVIDALRGSLATTEPHTSAIPRPVPLLGLDEMTPVQRARYERLRALSQTFASDRTPGATSDHSDLYDESGLPV